jgi:hypothetical protein
MKQERQSEIEQKRMAEVWEMRERKKLLPKYLKINE